MFFDPTADLAGQAGGEALLPKHRLLAQRTAGRETLVRDPESTMVHFLSPTAALIWECCDGATSMADCEARLRGAFEVPPGTDLARDIQETLADFAKKGLLENSNA